MKLSHLAVTKLNETLRVINFLNSESLGSELDEPSEADWKA